MSQADIRMPSIYEMWPLTRSMRRTRNGGIGAQGHVFAKSHLWEAFPNPQRIDCPSDYDLTRLAEYPRDADPSISGHIGSCSPCFKEFMEILAGLLFA